MNLTVYDCKLIEAALRNLIPLHHPFTIGDINNLTDRIRFERKLLEKMNQHGN